MKFIKERWRTKKHWLKVLLKTLFDKDIKALRRHAFLMIINGRLPIIIQTDLVPVGKYFGKWPKKKYKEQNFGRIVDITIH